MFECILFGKRTRVKESSIFSISISFMLSGRESEPSIMARGPGPDLSHLRWYA